MRSAFGLRMDYNSHMSELSPAGYEYDVFLSYKRDDLMDGWLDDHFVPFLRTFVSNALARSVRIFIDRDGIDTGDSWPLRLGHALSRSRCLVGIWSPLYFQSSWCRRECAVMMNRERRLGFRTSSNPGGLVVPVNVFDGEHFPDVAGRIQCLDCRQYWIVGEGFRKTERYVDFQDVMREWANDVAKAVSSAPPWQPNWTHKQWIEVTDTLLTPRISDNFGFVSLAG
jgi:hypothetical protein